jgi:hypothetical protein
LYSPLSLEDATIDGKPTGVESATELQRNVYSSFVSIPANQRRTLAVDLSGEVRVKDGWYELDLVPQPAVQAETVEVHVTVPSGWSIRSLTGLTKSAVSGTELRGSLVLDRPSKVRVLLRPRAGSNIMERLVSPPTTLP